MPDLDFGDSDEEAIIVLKGFAHRVNNDLYNHGKSGLVTLFYAFVTEHRTKEAMQERQHKANTTRLNIIIAILMAIAAYIALVLSVSRPIKTQVDPDKVFHSQHIDPEVSSFQQQISGNESRQP